MECDFSKEKLFDRLINQTETATKPLHAQIRHALRELIAKEYAHGDKFLSEPLLIQRLGVSQSTVRRALLDLTSEGLLIRKVPAGTFVTKTPETFWSVGIFVPRYDSPGLAGLLEYIVLECRSRNRPVILHHTHQNEKVAEAMAEIGANPSESRFILLGNPPTATRKLHNNLVRGGFRAVNVDTLLDNYSGDYVGVDNEAGVILGIRHLIDLGHRRICFVINESTSFPNIRNRVRAFQEEARKLDLSESRIFNCGTKTWSNAFDAVYRKMPEIFSGKSLPTAVMTTSDIGAWAVLKWLHEQSVKVPGQVSVVGFDGNPTNRYFSPALTSVEQPWQEIASAAVKALDSDREGTHQLLLKPHLVERESTAPPS